MCPSWNRIDQIAELLYVALIPIPTSNLYPNVLKGLKGILVFDALKRKGQV